MKIKDKLSRLLEIEFTPFYYEVELLKTPEEYQEDRGTHYIVTYNGKEQSIPNNRFQFATMSPLTPQELFDTLEGTEYIRRVSGHFKL